ncbi:MAG: VOC family protein [Chloroflexi bacterium]|nr:VOC family protein [Chloroflexota bacterium]
MKEPSTKPGKLYVAAFPFADDVLALPVEDIAQTVKWFDDAFGLKEIVRRESPLPAVIMERDDVRLGFAINGGDASQEGAAILVTDIHRAHDELEARGIKTTGWRVDERDGQKLQVFFVVAPDGLCFYFHQPLEEAQA